MEEAGEEMVVRIDLEFNEAVNGVIKVKINSM